MTFYPLISKVIVMRKILLNALAIATIASVNADNLALVDEERNANLSTCLELGWLQSVGCGIALETWLGVCNGKLNLCRQLSKEDCLGGRVNNYVANETLLEELNTSDEVVTDRHLLVSLLIHEDIILTLLVKILVWAALNAYILKFLANVEAALQNATINNIFELNVHDCVTLAWFTVLKPDYEIEAAIHSDANAILDIL